MRGKTMLILAALCLVLLMLGTWWTDRQTEAITQEIEVLRQEIEAQEIKLEVSRQLLQEVIRLRAENQELHRRMQEWLDTWDVDVWEATAYAPLDPRAREGMCYSGDPRVTASGAEVVPYLTAAAGPGIEFGTKLFVVGHGQRIVQDRGSRIGERQIDLAVGCRDEALTFGREPVKVVYQQ